jgi:NSS family neurotransmitter:Na+ symporter
VIFYLLVLIAAISSAISLIEVISTYFMDRAAEKGKEGNRSKIVFWVCVAIMIEASIVAIDGLGSNGVWVPFQNSLGVVGAFNDCWLDFMDFWSEGVAMPLGALLMSIMVGWEIKPKTLLDELHVGGGSKIDAFFSFCIKFIAPLGMILILAGQLNDFLGLGIF